MGKRGLLFFGLWFVFSLSLFVCILPLGVTSRLCSMIQLFLDILYTADHPLYTDTRYNDTFVIMTIWLSRNLRLRGNNYKRSQIMQECCIKYFKETCFGYLLESPQWGDSNKYPKHVFYGYIRTKQDLFYISICSLSILYNSKFILMATSLGTNDVVVMKVHCMSSYLQFIDQVSMATVTELLRALPHNFWPLDSRLFIV